MLVSLAQDTDTGDLAVDARGIRLAFGADAVVVAVTNAIRQRPYDDPADPSVGIPYETILGKRPSTTALEGLIARRVAEVRSVRSVVRCTATVNGATIHVELVLRTDEGEVTTALIVT